MESSQRLLKLTNPMMRGEDVKDVQKGLRAASFDIALDGIYG